MAKQTINIGASANDGTGDSIRVAFDKCNDNFDELYAGGSGITGSGTDNYIPKFNGTTALEDSQIIDNGTNVGIGTLPLAKLHVNGTFLVEDESDENPKFEITQTNINGIVDGSGFMISGSNVEFGQNVGDELIGLKIDVDGKNYLRNQLGDYFGLDSTTNLIISESLTSQGSPSNTTTPIKWILIKAGTTDYYLPLYQ